MPEDTDGGHAAVPPPQFTLRSLLVTQAACAVLLALLIVAGVWGVLIAFLGTLTLWLVRVRPELAAARRVAVDLAGGIVLPALCFLYDPGILWQGHSPELRAYFTLAAAWQILLLAAWQIVGRTTRSFAAVFAGALYTGMAIAITMGLALLQATLLGMIFLVGLLGFVPFLTALVYGRNASQAFKLSGGTADRMPQAARMALGVLVALLVPLLLSVTLGPWALGLLDSLRPESFLSSPRGIL